MCNYYIVIPIAVKSDKRLSDRQKLLYGDIHGLAHKDGYCFASNKYLADMYAVTISTISRDISALENSGHIRIEIDQSKGNLRRIWALTGVDSEPLTYTHTEQDPIRTADNRSYKDEQDLYQKGTRPYTHTEQEVCAEPTRPIRTADKYNNTINNTTNNTVNNTINTNARANFFEDVSEKEAEVLLAKSKEKFDTRAARQQIAKSIMEQFNVITGKNFPVSSHNTVAAIVKILDQYEEEDIIKVIELKTLETKVYRNGTPVFSRAHLTPFTLFEESKFEKYLQNAKDQEYIIELKKVYDNGKPKKYDAEKALRTIDRVIAERRAAKDAAKAGG